MKLTVITVCRNNLQGLRRTYRSVVEQTARSEFEWIIIDGDSTDGTKEWLAAHDSEIDRWISEPDTGIYNAMNKGVRLASGDYCLFINSGDYLFSLNAIADASKFLDNTTDFIYTDLDVYTPQKKRHNLWIYPDKLSAVYLKRGSLPHPSTLIRSNLLKNDPYNEKNKIVSDWEFFYRQIVLKNATYKKISGTISTFVLDGISSDYGNAIRQQLIVYGQITPNILKEAIDESETFQVLPLKNFNIFLLKSKIFTLKTLSKIKKFLFRRFA